MKKPKCEICNTSMQNLFIRDGNGRASVGYYCKFCRTAHINNGIKYGLCPVYIGLKKVID